MPKAKVCMLTSHHSALGDRIFYKESLSLQRAGYDVTLIAPLDDEGFLIDMGGNRIGTGETTVDLPSSRFYLPSYDSPATLPALKWRLFCDSHTCHTESPVR
jgi:hypothetical protein